MSDTRSGDDKTLSVSTKKTLSIKPGGISQSTVRQNFSHGRSNSVVVETKKRRINKPEGGAAAPSVAAGLGPRPALTPAQAQALANAKAQEAVEAQASSRG